MTLYLTGSFESTAGMDGTQLEWSQEAAGYHHG